MARIRRPPLRRESIDDHLISARLRFPELVKEKAEGSRALVRDLIRRGLIGKPYPIRKPGGPGRGVRFTPRDYRALLEILVLRARGHRHRSTWIVWLWLRGRDYEIGDVRKALAVDLTARVKTLRKEVAPTGRFTEPFVKKYRRNIAPTRIESPFPDLGGLEEHFAALMIRPREASQVPIDLTQFAALAASVLEVEERPILEAIQQLAASAPDDFANAGMRFAEALPPGPVRAMLETVTKEGIPDFLSENRFVGMIDDGSGNSLLLSALAAATDDQVLNARREIQLLRRGRAELAFRAAAAAAPSEQVETLLFIADWARMQRSLLRHNPALAAYLLCIHVQTGGAPIPLPKRTVVDVSALLKALRDGHL